jgi:site-specific DNA-cytosine methylase
MIGKSRGITVIDTFCGAGGFSEGFRQAGFDVVMGIDNWRPACDTHETNGFGEASIVKDTSKTLLSGEPVRVKPAPIQIPVRLPPKKKKPESAEGG